MDINSSITHSSQMVETIQRLCKVKTVQVKKGDTISLLYDVLYMKYPE